MEVASIVPTDPMGLPILRMPRPPIRVRPSTLRRLYWNNRSFANPHELMLVPMTGPGQFGNFLTTPKNLVNIANLERGFATGQSEIQARSTNAVPTPWQTPFGYLPNFFSSPELKVSNLTGGSPTVPFWQQSVATNPIQGAGWGDILELVETPPVYADGNRWLDPTIVNGSNDIQTYLLGARVAPFNFVSNYRVPVKSI